MMFRVTGVTWSTVGTVSCKRRRICVQVRVNAEQKAEPLQQEQTSVTTPAEYLNQIRSQARKYRKSSTAQKSPQRQSGVMKRVVGVDYGTHMTGLAFQIHGLWTAKPLPAIKSREYVYETAKEILELGLKLKVKGFVVGIPPKDGADIKKHWTDSRNARRCRTLAFTLAQLAARHNMIVVVCDENYTTLNVRLERNLTWRKMTQLEKRDVDSQAAIMILDKYFKDPQKAFLIKPNFDTRYMKKKYDESDSAQTQQQSNS
eukprot:TRINITY_DN6101_c0_g1_i3.p1 TRINITY_DN6101_c0_g1~~TRINITY_DN6101_c0_g1_i3.p1  ORF type:complete len:259 (-),score=23.34 TRINITY_DN6101_c0_g1_i3:564-1340(-)